MHGGGERGVTGCACRGGNTGVDKERSSIRFLFSVYFPFSFLISTFGFLPLAFVRVIFVSLYFLFLFRLIPCFPSHDFVIFLFCLSSIFPHLLFIFFYLFGCTFYPLYSEC